MKLLNTTGPGLLIGIPTLGRPVPMEWALAFKAMNPPINFNVNFMIVKGKEVADARNDIVRQAIAVDAKYLFFLGDDTVPPAHTLRQLLMRIENTEDCGVVGGVYCSKSDPPSPLVFRGNGAGAYWDWKIGEFFEVTGLGNDCTLFKTEVFKKISEPWFATLDKDQYLDGINQAESWTEDLYFFEKLRKETDYKVYCDAFVICEHWDVYGNKVYKLPADSLPMRRKGTTGRQKVLLLHPSFKPPENTDYVSFGFEGADYRGSLEAMPFDAQEFDIIAAYPELYGKEKIVAEIDRVRKVGSVVTKEMVTYCPSPEVYLGSAS
jgi:hypothetical protein